MTATPLTAGSGAAVLARREPRAWPAEYPFLFGAAGVGAVFAVLFLAGCALHVWIFDVHGHPVALMDFIVFWSAGHLAIHHGALAVYDPHIFHAAEAAVYGHDFPLFPGLPWWYPPVFLFVAVALALLPLTAAYLLWNSVLLLLHGTMAVAITGRRAAFFAVWAAPWTIFSIIPGQNGVLTASLIGLVLANLERREALAGILLGLLSYKPHFALLFPVALAFGGYWRAFLWAGAATLAWTALSCAVFGLDTFTAFLAHLSHATDGWLDSVGFAKLQSVYGLAHCLGAQGDVPWIVQGFASLACAVGVAALWRGSVPFALKAAGLVAAIPLMTPYIPHYDLPIVSVGFAFLIRERRLDMCEYIVLAAACLGVVALAWRPFPVGPFICVAMAALVWRRCRQANARDMAALREIGAFVGASTG